MTGRSADGAYYASKKPLNISGTREGSKNAKPSFSYRARSGDLAQSSDKYYASPEVQAGKAATRQTPAPQSPAVQSSSVEPRVKNLFLTNGPILEEVVAAFMEKYTSLYLRGTAEQIGAARTAVEMAVGRNVLTRAQADNVFFIAQLPATPVPAIEAEIKVEAEVVVPVAEEVVEETEQDFEQAFDTMYSKPEVEEDTDD